jgi:hypothetical protein
MFFFFLIQFLTMHQTSAQITDIGQMGGYSDLRNCAKCALSCDSTSLSNLAIQSQMGCQGWLCVCENPVAAYSTLSWIATSACTDPGAAVYPVSILQNFCAQYPGAPIVTTPTHFPTSTSNSVDPPTTINSNVGMNSPLGDFQN